MLCGAVASGGPVARWETLLILVLAAFMADPLWGALWTLIAEADWLLVLDSRRLPARGDVVLTIPYTAPGSPAQRFAVWLGRVRIWARQEFAPRLGGQTIGLVVVMPLLAALSLLLGSRAVTLSLAALGVALWALLARSPDGPPSPWLRALLEVGLPWLLGHGSLAPFAARSTLVMLGYTITYGASLSLPNSLNRSTLFLLNGGQVATLSLLVLWQQPIAATIGGLLLLAQVAAQTHLNATQARVMWYWQWTQPLLLVEMLLAALALR